jgi:uncharacterized beta barrel domain-containing protein DUF5777
MTCFRPMLLALVCVLVPLTASAQTPPAQTPTTQAPPPDQPDQSDPDARVDALQPDFNLAALPTTLRMPVHKLAFRVTHRFTRSLGQGDFGDLVSDLFGFDSGAQIGLELRYGLMRGTQVGVHRTSDRTIQIFGQHSFWTERDGKAIGLDGIATFEGGNNLQEHHKSTLGAIVSRNVARYAALYAEPMFVINSSPFETGDQNTLMLGLGTRLRVRPSLYLVGEITPRLAGFDLGAQQMSFGVEGRAGGHLFQLNFSNGFGTTLGQLANGAINYDNWYIGFNIARKFF